MKSQRAGTISKPLSLSEVDFELNFPEPDRPLFEGSGEPCTWLECMQQTATMTNFWLEHYGADEVPPPPWEERFTLD